MLLEADARAIAVPHTLRASLTGVLSAALIALPGPRFHLASLYAEQHSHHPLSVRLRGELAWWQSRLIYPSAGTRHSHWPTLSILMVIRSQAVASGDVGCSRTSLAASPPLVPPPWTILFYPGGRLALRWRSYCQHFPFLPRQPARYQGVRPRLLQRLQPETRRRNRHDGRRQSLDMVMQQGRGKNIAWARYRHVSNAILHFFPSVGTVHSSVGKAHAICF